MKKLPVLLGFLIYSLFGSLFYAKADIPKVAHKPVEFQNNSSTSPYIVPVEADNLVSSLVNATVKNLKNETIGQVKDVVIRGNEVRGFVLSVGGFLGVGERYVIVAPTVLSIHLSNGVWIIRGDISKESLAKAPEFKYQGRWGL